MKLYHPSTLLLFTLLFFSCDNDYSIREINTSHEYFSLTEQNKSGYLVTLTDPGCTPCRELFDYLAKEDAFSKMRIYNVNTALPDNRWWLELLYTSVTPTTLCFSPENEITDIYQGCSPAALSDLVKTVQSGQRKGYPLQHFRTRMKHASDRLGFYNTLFRINRLLDQNTDVSDLTAATIRQHRYPFNLYLAALNKLKIGQVDSARHFALEGLSDITPYKLVLFRQTRELLKKILDPAYDPMEQGMAGLQSHQLKFPDAIVGETQIVSFEIVNTGRLPLKIYDILGSGDQLSIHWAPNFPVSEGDTVFVTVKHTATTTGYFSHELYIISDGAEPYLVMSASSTVKSQ